MIPVATNNMYKTHIPSNTPTYLFSRFQRMLTMEFLVNYASVSRDV
jgi:hypothetical protein